MSYNIAFVREQGIDMVVLCVADSVVESPTERQKAFEALEQEYGLPAAIVGARRSRIYGNKRIVGWLSSIDLRRLPWRRAA